MKVVVFGGNGRIGASAARMLRDAGHQVLAVSRSSGVDALENVRLDEALHGADAVVDAMNAVVYDEAEVVRFFETTTGNIMAAERAAGISHHVALSIVGMDRISASGYLAGKVAQERAIERGGVPATIVRATQFFEFLPTILDTLTVDGVVHVPVTSFQPVAGPDVARTIADVVIADSAQGAVEIGGPERLPMAAFLRRVPAAADTREIVEDEHARYFGVPLHSDSLVPLGPARIGALDYASWVAATD